MVGSQHELLYVHFTSVSVLHWRGLKEAPSLDANICCKCSAGQFVLSCIDIKSCYVSLTSVVYNIHTFTVFCMGLRSPELTGLVLFPVVSLLNNPRCLDYLSVS